MIRPVTDCARLRWEHIDGCGSAGPSIAVALLMDASLIILAAGGGEGLSTAY
jgi:hypothetical protein